MRLGNCHNFHDFRALAKRRLPGPIFDYIDGAADDEATLRQNAASFERCDLVPNVLRGVGGIDLSVTVMGQKLAMPMDITLSGNEMVCRSRRKYPQGRMRSS
jgi:L-lactate dehydrogenase (cytochrome)